MSKVIFFIHGFLGQPEDYKTQFESSLRQTVPDAEIFPVDYMNSSDLGPEQSLEDWGVSFHRWMRQKIQDRAYYLAGYSLGGRLALQALSQDCRHCQGAFLYSVNPGLTDAAERSQRQASDQNWADLFLRLSWDEVMSRWNSQPVFQSSYERQRNEADFDRRKLSQVLIHWSLGRQRPMQDWIYSTDLPIDWYVGEYDAKFVKILNDLKVGQRQRKHVVPQQGHRLVL